MTISSTRALAALAVIGCSAISAPPAVAGEPRIDTSCAAQARAASVLSGSLESEHPACGLPTIAARVKLTPFANHNSQVPAGESVAPSGASPDTCTPEDIPFRFSAGNWVAPSNPDEFYDKTADGCQSVWLTSGKAATFILYYYVGTELHSKRKECPAGPVCQLWDPATNYELFYIDDFSNTTTSVNIYF